ncbi:PREDICTED: protein FLX-like 2 [Tarenaya hassleriana]|uniref:protein FLX-like 2 n=1 Tax=Tarenaya hassleriana TaxID=28532 RepID=UPI00053C2945|nr:PREDICTED: protein FLX-like 2 [Tarenaya hassleriana]XP_010552252.1 PREDICTED: protein FLX-like 2 [Tarenaya hassleriana]XP_019058085.1 PREDICTED: protein FLX-like 2 [Tarenaya hassleriana]
MGSNGRILPPHMRRPPPGPSMPSPQHGAFHPFNMLSPPEVMEQKIAVQHAEMHKLAIENQRLAATHGTLRQELVASQHELQMRHEQIESMRSEREQRMRGLAGKVAKMEAELQKAEAVRLELQQAHAEAQNLVVAREDLMSKVHQLTQNLQKARVDVQQIPALMSELENLRQEYQHCRATYDHEKKYYNDHLKSLQTMENECATMAREVEKLQAQLMNSASAERRVGGPYGSSMRRSDEASGYQGGHSFYEDSYGSQGHIPTSAAAHNVPGPGGPASYAGPGYDFSRGPASYEPQRVWPGHDPASRLAAAGPGGGSFTAGPGSNPAYAHAYETQARGGGNPGRR